MKFVSIIASVLSLFGSIRGDGDAAAAATEGAEAVYTLTTENFNTFIEEHGTVLVEFYAPWCGHCKKLAPEYESAAAALNANEAVNTVLAKVDATEEKDLASRYGVKGFPTLKYFTGGDYASPSDYSGGRTEATIISWISQRALPAITVITNNDELETFRTTSRVVLVSYLPEGDANAANAQILLDFAEANRESVVVGRVTNEELINSMENVKLGDIVLYRTFDTPIVPFEGELSLDNLKTFVNNEKFALIDAIGPENYKDYVDRGLPLVWIALDVSNNEELDNIINILTPYATDFKGQLSFTYVDNSKYAQHVSSLGITQVPGLIIVADNNKFLLKEELTAETIKTFFDGYKAGTLEIHLKSEDIPSENDENVFVLVGKNFNTVIGQDSDVFVEFYAPWCGHCKKLAPEYEKVGAAFEDVSNVVIAKIDATENDTPEEIKGFPTLFFYPKGQTKGEKYSGERTAEAIIEFIKTKASVDVSNIKTEL